jgi:hypothetical protein
MTVVVPRFEVADPHTRVGSPLDRRDTGKTYSNGDSEEPNLPAASLRLNTYSQVERHQWQSYRARPQSHLTHGAIERRIERQRQRAQSLV